MFHNMYTIIEGPTSSPAHHLGKLDEQSGHQRSFQGGNDELIGMSVVI